MKGLARFVVKYPYLVIGVWVVAWVLAVPRASRISGVLRVEGHSGTLTEAKRADSIINQTFDTPVSEFFVITVSGEQTVDDPQFERILRTISVAAADQSYISRVVSYLDTPDAGLISTDRKATFIIAVLDPADSVQPLDRVPEFRQLVHRAVDRLFFGVDYEVHVTGGPALGYDARKVAVEDSRRGEEQALPLVAIVLILAFGALVAAVIPLVIGVVAITLSLALVHVASAIQPMSVFVLNIVTMVGLAVGIDYSLLIVTRFREELNHGFGKKEAAQRTVHTAGKAVVTSGLTVAVGFASLLITSISDTRSVGVGGMIVVTVAVLLTTTLLPAVLALLGRSIDMPKALASKLVWYHAPSRWERWAKWLARHPWRAIVMGGVLIGTITWPVTQIKIGLPREGWFPSETESGDGARALERVGSRGSLQPLRVLLIAPEGQKIVGSGYLRGLKRLSDSIKNDPRVSQVRGPVDLQTRFSLFRLSMLYSDLDAARNRYPEFFESYISPDGKTTIMDVILSDTTSMTGSMDAARRIRRIAGNGIRGLDSVEISVTGFAASAVDLQKQLLAEFPLVIVLVLTVTAVMMFIAFQSVLVPLKAVVMNSLSVGGAFGLTVLVFQQGVGVSLFGLNGPIEAMYVVIPILIFPVVFGLSMDYEIFLLSRIKEAYERTRDNDQATMEGLSSTASVITSAATIMIIVFGAISFSRVLGVQLLGFGLAVAVFLDATIIRMVLVPAIMHIAGDWNWWPGLRAGRP
ncbi:MAG: MMPL family transporter [Gemmatimonadetes bacterium]|nr:MMPL family transporter [Gemmatimonadota bacterium]